MSNILDKLLYPSHISKAALILPPSDYEDISSGMRKPTNKEECSIITFQKYKVVGKKSRYQLREALASKNKV